MVQKMKNGGFPAVLPVIAAHSLGAILFFYPM
jgi:hypothetical protein